MGILCIVGTALFTIIFFNHILTQSKTHNNLIIALILLVCISIIGIAPLTIVANLSYPSDSKYPYVARVTLNADQYQTDVFFSSFDQNDSEVVINKYCIKTLHWTDFKGYDVITTPLIITLSDNHGKFMYQDRVTEEEFNKNNIAIQP